MERVKGLMGGGVYSESLLKHEHIWVYGFFVMP